MRISTKISISFTSVLVLTGVVGAIGWYGLAGYADGVANAKRMSDLMAELNEIQLNIADFRQGGHGEHLIAAQDRADALAGWSADTPESEVSTASIQSQLIDFPSSGLSLRLRDEPL